MDYIFINETNTNEEFLLIKEDFTEYAKTHVGEGVDVNAATVEDIFASLACAGIDCEIVQFSDLGIEYNFVLNVENQSSFEFSTKQAVRYREIGIDVSLFRLFTNNEQTEIEVFEAFHDDYDIGVELTHLFDQTKLLAALNTQIKLTGNIYDATSDYIALS